MISFIRRIFFTAAAVPLMGAFIGCSQDVDRDHAEHRAWDRDHEVYYVEPPPVYVAPPHDVIVHPETPRYYSRDW